MSTQVKSPPLGWHRVLLLLCVLKLLVLLSVRQILLLRLRLLLVQVKLEQVLGNAVVEPDEMYLFI